MSAPFVAEIRIVGFNFAPTGWAQCNGQILPISQNTALFSLLGTFYGGDGKSTFALPNMHGNAPVHQGQGNGLSERFLGETSGSQFVTLLVSEMPFHTHNISASQSEALERQPTDQKLANGSGIGMYAAPGPMTNMAFQATSAAGGSLPHNNMQPYLALNFIIAMQGVFPPRQ